MVEITDEYMREHLTRARGYTLVLLHAADQYGSEGSDKVIFEHGRRNFAMRAAGQLSIVCPVSDDSELCGLAIFSTPEAETRALMDDDPAVRAGIFTYEIHPVRSFPGDALPG
jgi:hypothetical protein